MTVDYQGNSKNKRPDPSADSPPTPPKNIERVIVTDVVIKKKGPGRKFKDLFIQADIKTVIRFVAGSVLLPAAKNMLFDSVNKGTEHMLYGNTRGRNVGQHGSISYNRPTVSNRSFGGSPLRNAPTVLPEPRGTRVLQSKDLIFTTREEADIVLEAMTDIIDKYDVVSFTDLNELVGIASSHTDEKWGWTNLRDVQIRQVREGFWLDFPPAEPI